MSRGRLRFAVDDAGALIVAGSPARGVVRMRLEAAGLCVEVPGGPTVVLSWDLYGKVGTVMDGPARDGWAIAYWIQGRGAGRGLALCVSGCVEAEAHPRRIGARPDRWARFRQHMAPPGLTGSLLPVLTRSAMIRSVLEHDTMGTLAFVLSSMPDLRVRLEDPARMARLAADLPTGLRMNAARHDGVRRESTDIATALRQAGYVHLFGRPLGPGLLPPLDEVVANTRAKLEANPFRHVRAIDDDQLVKLVHRYYIDVEPWPFGALVADD